MRKVIVVGAFDEIFELIDTIGLSVKGVIDFEEKKIIELNDYCYLGTDDFVLEKFSEYNCHSIFLTPDQPIVRKKLYERYQKGLFEFVDLISPGANISRTCRFKSKTSIMVQSLVNISSNVEIGTCTRINTMANIMHDCKIGGFVTIAPSAVLLGGVVVEEAAYIGASATVLPGLVIGANAMVGAGAVVTRNVLAGETVMGVPARKFKK